MTIKHHLTDALLMAYAAAELPEAFNLVIATHLSLCDDCRARAMAFDAVGGAVVSAERAEMAEGSPTACLARINGLTQTRPTTPARRTAGVPAPLDAYLGGGLDKVKWRPLGFGARQAILRTGDRRATVRLLSIPGGAAMPDHGHAGMELTLVLQGAFRDDDGRFGPGDIEVADSAIEHTPTAEPGQTCICLAATEAPLRFTSLIPRLAQPFFRI